MAAASVSPREIKPAVPMLWALQPMATPRTSGEEPRKTPGTALSRLLPREAPMQPVIRIEATASLGSHSGPMASRPFSPLVLWSYGTCEPSMPSADITERCSRGKDSGAGTPSGDLGFTAPTVVSKTEKQPEKQQVAKTHLKSSALSNQSPVVLYIRTPRPVTAAGSHWKNRSPTSRTA